MELIQIGARVEGHTSSFLINQGHGEIEIDILIKEVLDVEFENIIFAANRLGGRKNLKPCFIILLFGLIGIRGISLLEIFKRVTVCDIVLVALAMISRP